MPEFILDIGDPESGKTFHLKVDGDRAVSLIGKRIGQEVSGDEIGLPGYVFKITGGSDKNGFPLLPTLAGSIKKRILLSAPPGFRPRRRGERRAKTVRGGMISEETRQINMKVIKRGEMSLEEMLSAPSVEEQGG